MPAVRFSRDKRGYQYVYLVHTPIKRGKAGRSRVLYWYRTPPGVRIGRKPFDEEVQRLLERQNPGVSFDWEAIIGTPMPPPDMTEFWRERRKAERAARQERRAEEATTESADAPQAEPVNTGPVEQAEPVPPSAPAPSLEPVVSGRSAPRVPAALDAAPADGRTEDSTLRKKRRRRGGRRRKGPAAAGLQPDAPGGEPAEGDSADEGADDPSSEVDSTSEGE